MSYESKKEITESRDIRKSSYHSKSDLRGVTGSPTYEELARRQLPHPQVPSTPEGLEKFIAFLG